MERVAIRIGLAREGAKYDKIQKTLKKFITRRYGERAAGLIWLVAKHTCKPHNPKCNECVLEEMCEHRKKGKM